MNKNQVSKIFAAIFAFYQLLPNSLHAQNKNLTLSKSSSTGNSLKKSVKIDEAERFRQAQVRDFAKKILSPFYVDCGETFYITPDHFGLSEIKSSSSLIKPRDVLLFSNQKIEFEDPSPLELFKDPSSTRKYKVTTYLTRSRICTAPFNKNIVEKYSNILFMRILDYQFGKPSDWNYYFDYGCSGNSISLPTLEIKTRNGNPYLYDIQYTFFHRTEFRPNKYSIIDYIKEYVNNGGQFIIPKNYCSSPIRGDKIIKNHIGWVEDW